MTNHHTDSPSALHSGGTVLIGVDGSRRSEEALRWAAGYARLTGSHLHVLIAWHIPGNYGWGGPLPTDWDPETDAKMLLEHELADVLGPEPDVELTSSVVQGHPSEVLTSASRDATLVVVGSRGRGEFTGMLLGSVSRHLTAHAHCPVVVIRDGTETG